MISGIPTYSFVLIEKSKLQFLKKYNINKSIQVIV